MEKKLSGIFVHYKYCFNKSMLFIYRKKIIAIYVMVYMLSKIFLIYLFRINGITKTFIDSSSKTAKAVNAVDSTFNMLLYDYLHCTLCCQEMIKTNNAHTMLNPRFSP